MDAVATIFMLAIIIEAIVQVIKGWVPDNITITWLWPVISAVFGILLCLLAQVDVITLAGVELSIPYVGQILTGILISRGSNFMHDLWDKIKNGSSSGYDDDSAADVQG